LALSENRVPGESYPFDGVMLIRVACIRRLLG